MKLSYKGKILDVESENGLLKVDGTTTPVEIEKCSENILKIKLDGFERTVYIANDNKYAYVLLMANNTLSNKLTSQSKSMKREPKLLKTRSK